VVEIEAGAVGNRPRRDSPVRARRVLDWDAFLEGQVDLPSGFNTATQFSIDLKFDKLKRLAPAVSGPPVARGRRVRLPLD
jgi:hypothetical protein